MKCTVCTHPQRQDIDCALLAGNATYEALSQQYGPSLSAIYRHKKHLLEKMRRTEKRLQNQLCQDTLFRYNDYLETTRQVVRTAGADGDTRQTLRAVREGTRILNFITKLEVEFDPDTVYRVLASPQYVTQDSLLPTDPGIITGRHQTLVDHLFFPCPELILPDLDDDDEEEEEEEEAGDEIAEAAEAGKAAAISQLLARLDLDPSPTSPSLLDTLNSELETFPTANPKLEAENQSRIQREKSAKLPRNSRPSKKKNQQYQQDNISEKTSAKNPCVGRDPQGGASQSEAPPANNLESNDAPPAVQPSSSQPVNSNPELPPEPEPQHESLFVRLRRKWAKLLPPPPNIPAIPSSSMRNISRKKTPPWPSLPRLRTPPRHPQTHNQTQATKHSKLKTPNPNLPRPWSPCAPKKSRRLPLRPGPWLPKG